MNLIKPTKVNNESTKNLTKGGKAYERKTRKEKSKENKRSEQT